MSTIRNYYVRVEASDNDPNVNVFALSGEELTSWTQDFGAVIGGGLIAPFEGWLDAHCDDNHQIYFWQEDPSNEDHLFRLSETHDGIWASPPGEEIPFAEGLSDAGTPGSEGSYTKFDTYTYIHYGGDPFGRNHTMVYPYCSYHDEMGGAEENSFDCHYIASSCGQDYICDLSSGMSGAAATSSGDANVQLSGIYGSYEILSSSVATGVQMGQYDICEMNGTGLTSGASVSRANDLTGAFFSGGICTDDEWDEFEQLNVSGINVTFSAPYTVEYSSNDYVTYITGYSDRRHYVIYAPTVSGNKTVTSVDTDCPSTALQVTIGRSRTIHTLETLIAILSGAIHDVRVTLPANCVGYRTTLTASCPKFAGGYELFGERLFTQNNEMCWDAYFKTGIYRLEHDAASSFLATDKHTLGSGTLTAKAYV